MQERETIQPLGVFAIDPGPTQSAYVQATFTGDTRLLGTPIVIQEAYAMANELLLEKLVRPFGTYIVCEDITFYGEGSHVGKSVFDTCRWMGRFQQQLISHGYQLEFMPRQAVKVAVCNNTRAKDPDVRQALIDRYGEPGTKKNPGPLYGISGHGWQALGLAVAFAIKMRDSLRLLKTQPARNSDPRDGKTRPTPEVAERKFQQASLV